VTRHVGTDRAAERDDLLEERDFLLASLADLERERDAGDIDEDDYRALADDYTARAARVLRAIERGPAPAATSGRRSSWRRRLLTAGAVVVVAVVAGVLVAQSSGRRGSGGPTGLDVTAASSRIDDCQALERDDEGQAALDCYSEILESLPGNVAALTYRGWLQVREFDVTDGLEDLDAAVRLAPDQTAPYVFRASGRARDGDAPGAVADLAAFYDNGPSPQERELADQLAPRIAESALDDCIDGDVTGSRPAVEVLQCYQHVLTVDPGNPSASIYLGWLLARSGLIDQARALLDDGLETDPDLTAGYVFRAAVRAHTGDTAGARRDLERFYGADPPPDQRAAADEVRAAVEAGTDPLA
jgi:tetratricopeptide (TPR) repeat protein